MNFHPLIIKEKIIKKGSSLLYSMVKKLLLSLLFVFFLVGCTKEPETVEEEFPSFYSSKFEEASNFLKDEGAFNVFTFPDRLEFIGLNSTWSKGEVNSWLLSNASLPEPLPDHVMVDVDMLSSIDLSFPGYYMLLFPYIGLSEQDVFVFSSNEGLLTLYFQGSSSFAILDSADARFYFSCLVIKEGDNKSIIRPEYSGDANIASGCLLFEGNLAVWASDLAFESNLFNALFMGELGDTELVFDNGNVKVFRTVS